VQATPLGNSKGGIHRWRKICDRLPIQHAAHHTGGSGHLCQSRFKSFPVETDEAHFPAFHKRTGRIIKLLTVQEILDEAHVQKMQKM